jgi:myo-inositol catabolism protein IolC
VPAFIGFAVGRSTFAGPLREWRQGTATREQAVHQIASWYGLWTRTFIEAQSFGSPRSHPPDVTA